MSCGIDYIAPFFYLFTRFFIWIIILFLSSFDFYNHRAEKVYGWQLHLLNFCVLGTIVAKEAVIIIYQMLRNGFYFCFFLIFIDRVVLASYITMLMLIAYGWKITHNRLGENIRSVLIVPIIFFFSSVTHEYILHVENEQNLWTKSSQFLLFISSFVWLGSVAYISIWMYQTISIEKITLVQRIANDVSRHHKMTTSEENVFSEKEGSEFPAPSPTAELKKDRDGNKKQETYKQDENEIISSNLTMKTFEEIEREGESDEEDTNQYLPNTAKLALMTKFLISVIFYLIAMSVYRIVVVVKAGKVTFIALVFHDITFIVFTASLAYIFRLREHNPYLLLNLNENSEDQDILHEINVDTLQKNYSDDESD